MKKFYAILCLAIASLTQLQAQAPQGFNYQATVRNSTGDLIVNTNVYFKFNVIQGSLTAVPIFTETHYVSTDGLGQVNLVIGQGSANTGVFSELDWSLGSYYLGIELDTGNGYLDMGTTQLLSVPYALYAENSGNATSATPNLEAVLAENNSANSQQIKDLQDPTEAQDAATKNYVDTNLNSFSGSYNDLTDTPTIYTQAQVDELISNLQTQMDALTPPQGTAAINHNNKTYSGVSCEGFWLGFKFSVSDTQTITALGAWDEGHNIEVNDEFSSCPEASNFSVPIAIYKNDVLVLEKVINASIGFVIGNSRYINIDDFVLTPGDEYFIIGNYEGSSKFGYFDSNLVTTDYDSRITPLTVTSSPLFSKNTNGDGTFPSNLTTLSDNQWSDQYFHVNFLLKD
jgi:hypothetical protein